MDYAYLVKRDEAVIADATYIKAERYDWRLSKPLKNQSLREHRQWMGVWQSLSLSDLYHFPLWEKGVFDCLQECFQDLTNIFAHYVIDEWFEGTVKRHCAGEVALFRYGDDVVICCRYA